MTKPVGRAYDYSNRRCWYRLQGTALREGLMGKVNCWEFKKCGREAGGAKAAELGVCPASMASRITGANSGRNGGRACWAISGTLCGGKVQGTYAAKLQNCLNCEFYKLVATEEGPNHESAKDILSKLRNGTSP